MFRHVYSYGKDSPLKVKITDRQAADYNFVVHMLSRGTRLEKGVIPMGTLATYNAVCVVISRTIKASSRDFTAKDIHSNILIKN